MEKIGVVQYGLGPIGVSTVKLLLHKRGVAVVGAVDIDPAKAGKSLADVVGDGRLSGIEVVDRIEKVHVDSRVKVTIHATGSYVKDVLPQLREIASHGFHIISSCEELAYPWREHLEITRQIDRAARDYGVSILGTGVNPGFLMDTLAITLTGVCQRISKIECRRIQDAALRRLPFQRKIGAGLTLGEFQDKVNAGVVRHVGFRESIWMIADSLGWNLDKIDERVEPIIADRTLRSRFITVEKGQVAGIDQTAVGEQEGNEKIRLNLQAYLGCETPRDEVYIEGTPNLEMQIKGGVNGDIATAAMLVNTITKVVGAEPGLHTMRDLPIPSALLGDVRELL